MAPAGARLSPMDVQSLLQSRSVLLRTPLRGQKTGSRQFKRQGSGDRSSASGLLESVTSSSHFFHLV